MKSLLLTLCAAAFLPACSVGTGASKDVAQDKIWQQYRVEYNGTNGTQVGGSLDIEARFRFDDSTGTNLELSAPSTVTHENHDLTISTTFGAHYTYDSDSTPFEASHAFTWTDTEGKVFKNTVTIDPVNFVSAPTTISKAAGATITFDGGATTTTNSVTLTVTATVPTASGGSSYPVKSIKAAEGATTIAVTTEDLADFTPPVTVKAYLTRSKNENLTEGTSVGGSREASFTTKEIEIDLAN